MKYNFKFPFFLFQVIIFVALHQRSSPQKETFKPLIYKSLKSPASQLIGHYQILEQWSTDQFVVAIKAARQKKNYLQRFT